MESRNALLLRLASGFVLAMGVALVVLRVVTGRQAGEAVLPMIASAGVFLMLGVGLGLGLLGLARLLERPAGESRSTPVMPGVAMFQDALKEIRDELSLLRSNIAAEQARREDEEESRREALEHATVEPESLHRVLQLLEELRELTLLNDQQRQERLHHYRQQRKRFRLRTAQEAIAAGDFARAQRIIEEVRHHFPDDEDLHQVADELRIARINAEADMLGRLKAEVEDLMALAHWDEAYQKAQDFAAGFPGNAEGQALLARVTRERDLYRDNTAEHIYKEVREHLEQRQWRAALAEAERLIAQFPDHRRAQRVAEQIDLIRENAQIQERKETEERIEELIRGKHFNQAIELAEDLIERYPESPQAKTLSELLPRLRERAIKDEITQA